MTFNRQFLLFSIIWLSLPIIRVLAIPQSEELFARPLYIRPQVILSVFFEDNAAADFRHAMANLVHPSFILTSVDTYNR